GPSRCTCASRSHRMRLPARSGQHGRGTDGRLEAGQGDFGVSAVTKQLVDTALQLALLLLAAAQPRVEIALWRVRHHGAKGEADAIGLPPDHPGEEGTSLVRDGKLQLVGKARGGAELDAGAGLAEIADHAVHGRAALIDLGDAAEKHLVAYALAPVLHSR